MAFQIFDETNIRYFCSLNSLIIPIKTIVTKFLKSPLKDFQKTQLKLGVVIAKLVGVVITHKSIQTTMNVMAKIDILTMYAQ